MLPIALGGYVVLFAVVVAVFYGAGRSQIPTPPSEETPLEDREVESEPHDHELV
jgi:hypothetical protein